MRPLVLFQGVYPPRSGPGSSVSHPSGALKGRRPRWGGGLCSLPKVATGFDVETGTAPPLGRGPLFASQRSYRNRLRVGHGAPACAGASFRFPRSPYASTSGRAWRRVTWPPASLKASHRRGSAATLRPGRGRAARSSFATGCAVISSAPHTNASSKPQGFSSQSGPPPFRAQTTPTSGRASAA